MWAPKHRCDELNRIKTTKINYVIHYGGMLKIKCFLNLIFTVVSLCKNINYSLFYLFFKHSLYIIYMIFFLFSDLIHCYFSSLYYGYLSIIKFVVITKIL